MTALFTSGARVAVLRIFMLDPSREYYQRQLEAAAGLPIRAVQRELERLTSAGLLYRRVEGNRTYYRVDTEFALFPELRNLVMKSASEEERLRGVLAMDESVRLLFLDIAGRRALVVTAEGAAPTLAPGVSSYALTVLSTDAFLSMVTDRAPELDPFLVHGVDLLGRREDVLWRRIEGSGYEVKKGRGVP